MIERLKMEKRAIVFREKLGIGHAEPIQYYDILKRLGVITLFASLSDGISGMAIKVDEYRFMLINSNMSLGKQNFTICHELYHLYEQESFTFKMSNAESFSKKDKEEYLADVFAAHLLLPNDGIVALIPEKQLAKDKIQLITILEIEQRFQCSRLAVLFRLKELGLLTDEYSEQFKESTTKAKAASANNYPTDIYFPANKNKFIGDDYISVMEMLNEKGLIKEIDYITSMQDIGVSKI